LHRHFEDSQLTLKFRSIFGYQYHKRFDKEDTELQAKLSKTQTSYVKQADYDAVFYPGGHGPLWDLATDASSALIEAFIRITNLLLVVCHSPAVLKT
jgi:putative intracellular protease/amidase